jgi:hypothetical protein
MLLYAATAATRVSATDETPARLLLLCKRLTALCSLKLHINSSSYCSITALDALALAELTALTSLQVTVSQNAADALSQQQKLSIFELSPLTRLTSLQELSIHGWQPLGLPLQDLPVAVPAAANVCCLPRHVTSLQLHNMHGGAVVVWLPSVLACTGLQHLHMHVSADTKSAQVNHIMTACARHLTGMCAEPSKHTRQLMFGLGFWFVWLKVSADGTTQERSYAGHHLGLLR